MKTAIIFGSTGLIGNHLLRLLLNFNHYNKIKIFTRSSIEITHSKIEIYNVDFAKIDSESYKITGDDCFFCIGTTRKKTPIKNDYIDIELNLPIKIAEIAKKNKVKSFFFVSSGGANSKSNNIYLQSKGKAEDYIINLGFEFTAIIQPSLLLGVRKEFRMGERIAQIIFKNISFILTSKFRAIKAITVARAIIKIIKNNKNDLYFPSDKLENLGK